MSAIDLFDGSFRYIMGYLLSVFEVLYRLFKWNFLKKIVSSALFFKEGMLSGNKYN